MPISTICPDASLIVALVTSESVSERALARWTEWVSAGARLVAPGLLRYEVTSALRRKVVRGLMSEPDARRALGEALDLGIELFDPPGMSVSAFDLAGRFGLPTTYDAHYLALADEMAAEFWTADERLYNTVRGKFPAARCVGKEQ